MRGTRSVGVVLVVVALAALLVTGCGKQKTTNTTTTPVKKTTTPASSPQGQVVPQEELVIYNYYDAINDKRYQDAYNLTSDAFKSHYTSFSAFEASYRDYVSSVAVVSLTRLDQFSTNQRIEYQAVYDAKYIKPYPGGGGTLPTVNVVVPDTVNENHWTLDEIGTGP
jgi:hypothetical protein